MRTTAVSRIKRDRVGVSASPPLCRGSRALDRIGPIGRDRAPNIEGPRRAPPAATSSGRTRLAGRALTLRRRAAGDWRQSADFSTPAQDVLDTLDALFENEPFGNGRIRTSKGWSHTRRPRAHRAPRARPPTHDLPPRPRRVDRQDQPVLRRHLRRGPRRSVRARRCHQGRRRWDPGALPGGRGGGHRPPSPLVTPRSSPR